MQLILTAALFVVVCLYCHPVLRKTTATPASNRPPAGNRLPNHRTQLGSADLRQLIEAATSARDFPALRRSIIGLNLPDATKTKLIGFVALFQQQGYFIDDIIRQANAYLMTTQPTAPS